MLEEIISYFVVHSHPFLEIKLPNLILYDLRLNKVQ